MATCRFDEKPTDPGWYGTLQTAGEGEHWVQAAYWDGSSWDEDAFLAYWLPNRFDTEEAARDFLYSSPEEAEW